MTNIGDAAQFGCHILFKPSEQHLLVGLSVIHRDAPFLVALGVTADNRRRWG
jgi:hypothetical protein